MILENVFLFITKEQNDNEEFDYKALSDTDLINEYETDIDTTIQLEESSGLDISAYEGSGMEEDIVASPDATNFLSEKVNIEEDIFLPVINEEEMDISEVVESSGTGGTNKFPDMSIPKKSMEDTTIDDKTVELPSQEKSTSGANSMIISFFIFVSFISCIFF